jgi:hypothetical protein
VTRPRAADDFAMIRARMEELRRERAIVQASAASGGEPPRGPMPHYRAAPDQVEPEERQIIPRTPLQRPLPGRR